MTTRQIELVQSSWSKVATIDTLTVGSKFYNNLFEIAPHLKIMFRNTNIEEQSKKLLSMLGYVVSKLNKLDDIIPEVKKLAMRHVGYGVHVEDYANVGNALIWTLQQGLGADWNNELKAAWTEAYMILAEAMINVTNNSASPRVSPLQEN